MDALKQFAEIVEVGEGSKIRRKGEVRENAGFERSVYAVGRFSSLRFLRC